MSEITIGDMTFIIPFSDLLPPLTERQYSELRADIAERGIVVPVILGKGNRIIDGQHRMRIAADLGLSLYDIPRETQAGLSDDQEHDLCIDLNMHRRQLSVEERQAAVLRLRGQGKSYREIGDVLGIGVMTAHDDVKKATVRGRTVETEPITLSKAEQATVPPGTVQPDQDVTVTRSVAPSGQPDRVVGKDGRSRPAIQPRPQRLPDPEIEQHERAMDGLDQLTGGKISRDRTLRKVEDAINTVATSDAALVAQAADEDTIGQTFDASLHYLEQWIGRYRAAKANRHRVVSLVPRGA